MLHHSKESLRISARRESLHFAFDRERQNVFLPQRQCPQNNHGDSDDRADQERPHEDAALDKESRDGFKHVRHQFGNIVKVICSSKPSGGSVLATSSGIGGIWISMIDWRHTLAKASLELLLTTLRFFTRPLRSMEKPT